MSFSSSIFNHLSSSSHCTSTLSSSPCYSSLTSSFPLASLHLFIFLLSSPFFTFSPPSSPPPHFFFCLSPAILPSPPNFTFASSSIFISTSLCNCPSSFIPFLSFTFNLLLSFSCCSSFTLLSNSSPPFFHLPLFLTHPQLFLHLPLLILLLLLLPQVVYLLCVRLSCLALALPAPPEVLAELEKRSAIRTLSAMVKETLASNHFLYLLSDEGSWVGSASSWDEPLGSWRGRREVLSGKRSYSDSDLSKITVLEVGFSSVHSSSCESRMESDGVFSQDAEWSRHWSPALGEHRHWCAQDLIGADRKPAAHIDAATRKQFHCRSTESSAKRWNEALHRAPKFKKCRSSTEVGGTSG